MIVARLDTKTGATVLFSLPRNLQRVRFPRGTPAAAAYPSGFYCVNPANGVNTDCLLNGIWTFAENHAGDYYRGVRNPGLTATMQAAETVTGLSINNYVMIDLKGFKPSRRRRSGKRPFRFLFVGRLLRDKGLVEYAEAARLLRARWPEAEFAILGFAGSNNRSAVPITVSRPGTANR